MVLTVRFLVPTQDVRPPRPKPPAAFVRKHCVKIVRSAKEACNRYDVLTLSKVINSCGRMYGGCYPFCSGYTRSTFTGETRHGFDGRADHILTRNILPDPGCPTLSTSKSTITSSPISSICTQTLCVDKINSCGQTYGGCYPACSGFTTPSFTDPGCPTITSKPISTSCTNTLCVDKINSCGKTYGGCYPACPGLSTPTFTDPGCPTTTLKPTSTICTQTLCVDKINSCGQTYGGCYPACSGLPTPTFTDPGCPTSSSKVTITSKPTSSVCTSSICVDKVSLPETNGLLDSLC
jgi:hypothetical protein